MTTLVKEQTLELQSAEPEVGLGLGIYLRELTVGGAVALVVLIAAAFMRLYALGSRPIGEAEAARAWLALQYVRGQPVELTGFSPLLANMNVLVFFLAGAGNFWARLVPALVGIMLVVLPVVRFRRRLGTGAALAASALVAVSPTFLLFSRSIDPALLSAVSSLLFVGAIFDFLDRHERRDLLVAAGTLAVALTAGSGTYTVLLFLLVFVISDRLLRRYRGTTGADKIAAAYSAITNDHDGLAQAGAVFGATFVAAATGFLVNFGGIQGALNLFVEWLASFSLVREYPLLRQSSGQVWYYAGTLVLYEPAILLFGLLGGVAAVRRRDLFGSFLVTWFAGSLLLYTLLGQTESSLIVPILLPLALLAGRGVASVFEFLDADEGLRALLVAAFVLPLMAYAILQLAFYAETAARSINLFLALGAAAMAVVVAVIFASTQLGMAWGPATVARGVGISLLLFSLGLALHMAWHLNFLVREPMREVLLADSTSTDMREMVTVLETVSQDRMGDTVSIPIAIDGRVGSIVPWYLRDFTNVTVVDEVRQPPGTPVVVMPATDAMPPIGDQYVGQGFRLSSRWEPAGLTGAQLARWYFYREGPAVPTNDLIVFVTR